VNVELVHHCTEGIELNEHCSYEWSIDLRSTEFLTKRFVIPQNVQNKKVWPKGQVQFDELAFAGLLIWQ